jgi:membrane-associated phospholipid phosphatase
LQAFGTFFCFFSYFYHKTNKYTHTTRANMNTFVFMKRFFIYTLCALLTTFSQAQNDSTIVFMGNKSPMVISVNKSFTTKQFNKNRLHHSFCVAAPIATIGLAMIPADISIRNGVNRGLPHFHTSIDDYIQYAPLATQLCMGMIGIEGRSKNRWQILVSDAMAATIMATVVNGMKYSINRTRPNGSDHSFPSGHTATAFMGATLLAHEYGHKSVWIPISGYTVAAATGALRVLNNSHYVSDVLVGAAVGILSAELAYWATDAIFKDKKIFRSRRARVHYEVLKNY